MLMNVMLGRVYFCCHYIGDCQVGFGIGITSAFFINLGMQTMGFWTTIKLIMNIVDYRKH